MVIEVTLTEDEGPVFPHPATIKSDPMHDTPDDKDQRSEELTMEMRQLMDQMKVLEDQHPVQRDTLPKKEKLPRLNLSTFDGTGSVIKFLEKYDSYAEVQGLGEQKINLLFAQLEESVADWYATTVRPTRPQTWQEFAVQFLNRYGGVEQDVEAKDILRDLRLKSGELVTDYFHHVIRLCQKINPRMKDKAERVFPENGVAKGV